MARTNPAKKAGTKPAAKKTTAKKATAPKATATKATATKATKTIRGPRGHLAQSVLAVCTDYSKGKLNTKVNGKPLTPHRVAALVQERTGDDTPPSTGAVSAVFDRWAEYGFALFSDKPKAFKKFSAAGEKLGLEGLIAKRSEDRKAERAKAKKAA